MKKNINAKEKLRLFAKRLRALRNERGWTQEELSYKLGCSNNRLTDLF